MFNLFSRGKDPALNKLITYCPLVKWDSAQADLKLDLLYKQTLVLADASINWYLSYRSKKGNWSKFIRFLAILLFIISTLMPYFSALSEEVDKNKVLYYGYIFAGIGGGLLLFDKYYGFSNSWVRFVLTGKDLENLRNEFVCNWQIHYIKNLPLDKQGFCNMVDIILTFQKVFNDAIKAETTAWATEFQQSFNELIGALKVQSEKLKADMMEKHSDREAGPKQLAAKKQVPMWVIKLAVEKHSAEWKKKYNLLGVGGGKKRRAGEFEDLNCIVFVPEKKINSLNANVEMVPESIYFDGNDQKFEIPTDVIAAGSPIRAAAEPLMLCDDVMVKRPGCSISRKGSEEAGTLGLKVYKDNRAHLLSCYHVLCSPELNSGKFVFSVAKPVGSPVVTSPAELDKKLGKTIDLGQVTDGVLNNYLDCAIALLDDESNVNANVCAINETPVKPISITEDHVISEYQVISVGRTSGRVRGKVLISDLNCDIIYIVNDEEESLTIEGVIATDMAMERGDSGAPVMDKMRNVIGLVIGCSEQMTYVLPIKRILTKFSLTLNQTI